MEKTEYDAQIKQLYQPSAKTFVIVTVPPMQYAMFDGTGDPNTSEVFADAVSALYAVSYGIKMQPKKGIEPPGYFEYKVNALEGIWNLPEGQEYDAANKGKFIWTLMIMQPPFVTQALFDDIRIAQRDKKKLAALDAVRLETLDEGLCCQMTHIGPFDDEPATFARMHSFREESGYSRIGMSHHEIYMSDFRKTAPEKLKTVLRYKVEKKQ